MVVLMMVDIKKSIERIKELEKKTKQMENEYVLTYWDIGKELCFIKDNCNHGELLKIIEKNFDFSDRQARRYMQIYNNFNSDTVSNLSIRKLLDTINEDEDYEEFDYEEEISPIEQLSIKPKRFVLPKKERQTEENLYFKLKNFLAYIEIVNGNINTLNIMISHLEDGAFNNIEKEKILALIDRTNNELSKIGRLKNI